MTPERWRQVAQLFERALPLGGAERAALLDGSCVGDPALREELESLLASAHRTDGFLAGDALQHAAPLLDDAEPEFPAGGELGTYLLERWLGGGGMGEVYVAHDRRLDRKVALKLLAPTLARDPSWRQRFLREARLASALDHPNICAVHEVGEEGGRPYIAMQLVEGRSLKEVIGHRPLDRDAMLAIALQVADALAAAHDLGIVHRDVKPDNVMVTPRGDAKVLDFGIAKRLDDRTRASGAADTQTVEGTVLGTPASMSPEQACGDPVDARSDVFSFGVVLYEMATGRAPFAAGTRAETIRALTGTPHTPAMELNPAVPAGLSAVIDRALAKAPAARYPSMRDLIGDLRRVQAAAGRGSSTSPAAPAQRGPAPGQRGRWWASRAVLTSLAAAVAVAGLVAWLWRSRANAPPPIRSLAVLPFKPLVSGQADESLQLGMADTLIARLANLRELRVRSISAVRKYAGSEKDAVAAGREQGVDAVLDGHIQTAGQTLRVTVRLVRVADETPLWTEQFDTQMTGVFAVQDAISERVAAALQVRLSGDEMGRLIKSHTKDPEAYRLYLLGRYHLNRFTDEGFWKGLEYFQQAIDKDPSYALAHAGVAAAYNSLAGFDVLAPKQAFPKVKQAAEHALRLDERLAEAHIALGTARLFHDWSRAEAEREYRRALELKPGSSDAHYMYGYYLASTGRFDEAGREMERAHEIDPLSVPIICGIGEVLLLSRRFDEAAAQFRKGLEMDPNFGFGYWSLGRALMGQGRYDEAIAAEQRAISLSGDSPDEPAELGRAYALAGRHREALEIVEDLKRRSRLRYIAPSLIAAIHGALGDRDEAFAWLDKAFAERDIILLMLEVDPIFDPLRSDPRLGDLLARMKLSR